MELDKLLDILKKCLIGSQFTLPLGYLESPQIDNLLKRFFRDNTLMISNVAEVYKEGERIKTRPGTLDQRLLALENPVAEAEFWLDQDNVPQVKIQCSKAMEKYVLAQGFESLHGHSAGDFTFKNPTYTLQSAVPENTEYPKLQKEFAGHLYSEENDKLVFNGLSFSGEMYIGEYFSWLKNFLDGTIHVEGAIQLIDNVPRMCLKTAVVGQKPLGPFSMQIHLEVITLFAGSENETGTTVFYSSGCNRFSAVLQYHYSDELDGDTVGQLDIPIDALFATDDPAYIVFRSNLHSASALALKHFSKLLSGIEVGEWTAGLPAFDTVLLDQVTMVVSVSDLRIGSITADFVLNNSAVEGDGKVGMELIKDLINIDKLKISFTIHNPFTDNFNVSAEATGTVSFAANPVLTGGIDGRISLPDIAFGVELARFSQVDFSQLIHKFLPAIEIPQLVCHDLGVYGNVINQEFGFHGSINSDLQIPLGITEVMIREVGLSFNYAKGSTEDKNARLYGQMTLAEKVEVDVHAGVSGAGWRFGGSFALAETLKISQFLPQALQIIPEEILQIGVKGGSLDLDTGAKTLEIALETDNILNFGSFGRLESTKYSLYFAKGKEGKSDHWRISTVGHLVLLDLIQEGATTHPVVDLAGTLTIEKEGTSFKIEFVSDGTKDELALPTLLPGKNITELMWVHYGLKSISLGKEKGWSFKSALTVYFRNVNDYLRAILPTTREKGVDAELNISSEKAAISLKNLLGLEFPVNIPAVPEANLPAVDLGIGKAKIEEISLALGKKVEFSAKLAVYLPSRFNYIFGSNESGKPRFEIFETYKPDKPDESKACKVTAYAKIDGDGVNVGARIDDLPIKLVEIKDGYWNIILGTPTEPGRKSKYGYLKVKIPEFKYTADGLEAAGGFEIVEALCIPLSPVKDFLNYMKIPHVLPDSYPVPLKLNPFIKTDEQGNKILDLAVIKEFFKNQLPPEIDRAFGQIERCVSELPNAFLKYLEAEIPKDFAFAIKVTADGGCDIKLRSESGIKLMLPNISPVLQGVCLREFSLGQMLGGQLITFSLDADFDMIDVVTLAATILAKDFKDYIGQNKLFHQTLNINKLWAIVFYQAGVPIPIPVFYDKLGIDYYGLGDISFRSSIGFKKPKLNVGEIGKLFGDLVQFLTNKNFPLDPKAPYTDCNLKFEIGPAYVDSGKPLGNKIIGFRDGLPIPSVYELVANLLNGIKFMRMEDLLRVIPVNYRINKFDESISIFNVINMSANAKWMISSPEEFITEKGYVHWGITEAEALEFMKLLVKKQIPDSLDEMITTQDKGLIIFLKGRWETDLIGLAVNFGLIATDSHGFRTGFSMDGYILGLLSVKLRSYVRIDPSAAIPYEVYGEEGTNFSILGIEIFHGETKLHADKTKFAINGKFDFLDDSYPFSIHSIDGMGGLFKGDEVHLKGGIRARFLIFTGEGYAEISNYGVDLYINFGRPFRYKVMQENGKLVLDGNLPIGLIDFHLRTALNPETLFFDVNLDGDFAGLMSLSIYFGLGTGLLAGATGQYKLYLLKFLNPIPVMEGDIEIRDNDFGFGGRFHLFPDGSPVNLIANLRGELGGRLYLHGDAYLEILGARPYQGYITITDTGITGELSDYFFTYKLEIVAIRGKVTIICSGSWYSFYINDEPPYLHWGRP